ncbi:hypothetical protein UVI_02051390 [Ustilaginoidea virens]|uniref:Polyketide synthase-like methyltransferase domain-containing protein n=1 Tax=Ustilaginoidea virens TaxID=1159556 RepID=A0A1B5KXU8_USTVR|nr:hypothetical protein UVI_02051390 [Ustilaginoidea virens]
MAQGLPESWLQSCARAAVLRALRRIKHGRLALKLAYRDGGDVVVIPQAGLVFRPANDAGRARLNAAFHYDASNTLFSSFLSADMNYSCGLWSGHAHETLESAQLSKVAAVLHKARVAPDHHVLDIGCGWGHLAIEAAQRTGCRVTGVTLSRQQKQLAEKRVRQAGLEDRVQILLCDYREIPRPEGGYDSVVSVEMLEHVGEAFLPRFFASIRDLLKADGVMVIQGTTVLDPILHGRRAEETFITRYVFPGGHLPSLGELVTAISEGSQGALEMLDAQGVGGHYVKTLQCWRQNFLRNWDAIREDYLSSHEGATEASVEAFRRKWVYYFAYCEQGFRSRIIGDYVISAAKIAQEPSLGG